MKQFWTPLARVLGMVGSTQPDHSKPHSPFPSEPAPLSQWPGLYQALRDEAQSVWCAKSIKHSEVNPDEILSITALCIQAGNQAMDEQLRNWFAESDELHLIQWMINGPLNTAHIRQYLHLDSLNSLQISHQSAQASQPEVSPYSQAGLALKTPEFQFTLQSHWITRPPAPKYLPDCKPLQIKISDARGQNHLNVHHHLFILGSNSAVEPLANEAVNTLAMSDLNWHGESAKFILIQAAHTSAFHLLLRSHENGFEVQDLGSTNGTYIQDEKLPQGQIISSVLPLTLGLGGPFSDPVDLTACVQIAMQELPRYRQQPTPLRKVNPDPPPLAELSLLVMDGNEERLIKVDQFPFEIGRDPSSNWIVSPSHVMVSRRHLVLESADFQNQLVQVLDISRHGLTISPEGFSDSPKTGTWVKNGQTLILGRTQSHSGVSFRMQWSSVAE